jgi:hypothetical protein
MHATVEHTSLATLETRRQALLRELAQVERHLRQTDKARARLEQRIEVLERKQRQAA